MDKAEVTAASCSAWRSLNDHNCTLFTSLNVVIFKLLISSCFGVALACYAAVFLVFLSVRVLRLSPSSLALSMSPEEMGRGNVGGPRNRQLHAQAVLGQSAGRH